MGTKKSSIMEFFPGTPRDVQTYALKAIEESWDSADVFVVGLSVGAGKSLVAYTVARWLQTAKKLKSSIIVPTNILLDQYTSAWPKLHTIRNMDHYVCETTKEQEQKHSCKQHRALDDDGKFCPGCPYMKDVRKGHVMPYGVYNNYTYLAHRLFRDVLISDESHAILPMLQDFAGRKLWHKDYKFPSGVRNYRTLLNWVQKHPRLKTDPKLQLLQKELLSGSINYLVQRGTDVLRGKEEECLKLLPLDVRNSPPLLWPSKVKKLVLMSATIGRKDIEAMGLDRRRVRFIEAPSPIPKERRPIVYQPIGTMSAASQEANLPKLADYIRATLKAHEGQAGMIHAPYSMAERLRALLSDEPRLLFHSQDDKTKVYDHFRERGPAEGLVLVASGLYEGVSLDEDAGRFQIIAKVPYANLGEPAIKYQAETDPEAYAWNAARLIIQASGRVCRGPEDYGVTYIADEAFERLYNNWEELFPRYVRESIDDRSNT